MTIEEKEDDSRSTISAAFEAYETANEDESPEVDETPDVETSPDKNEGTLSLPGKSVEDKVEDTEDTEAVPEEPEAFKPPQSWTPAAREGWDKVPDALKAQISKREGEMNAVFAERKDLRGVNDNVDKLFSPFSSMFQAQGIDPWRGTYNVLNMAAQLQGGSKAQKAQVTLQLIKDFGVDITALDDLMVGKEGIPSPTDELADLRSQLAQTQQWQQQQQYQQQQVQQQAQQVTNLDVEAFVSANEFAGDLRLQMADFMDMAEKGGEGKISLDVAYQRALASRPDLQALLTNRQSSVSNTDALARANAASVSVPQTSSTGSDKIAPTNRRDALLDAWNSA
jgi:hypothetical protein